MNVRPTYFGLKCLGREKKVQCGWGRDKHVKHRSAAATGKTAKPTMHAVDRAFNLSKLAWDETR